jgi:hypothetical protein
MKLKFTTVSFHNKCPIILSELPVRINKLNPINIQAYMYLRNCITHVIVTPSKYGLYPRIHRRESMPRRAVGPNRHDYVAYTIV